MLKIQAAAPGNLMSYTNITVPAPSSPPASEASLPEPDATFFHPERANPDAVSVGAAAWSCSVWPTMPVASISVPLGRCRSASLEPVTSTWVAHKMRCARGQRAGNIFYEQLTSKLGVDCSSALPLAQL